MALIFMAFGIWALWVTRRPRIFLVFTGVYLGVLVWWISIRPSHDRHWRPEVAVMPRAIIDGDRVRIMGCRNFEYRTRDDFTVRYDEREVSLSHIVPRLRCVALGSVLRPIHLSRVHRQSPLHRFAISLPHPAVKLL